ncbi:MAG TPA: amino acid--tRNA ligase-related protein [Candidatus Paceibacterota bacterium]|jgi:aspartyl-tRNA synthetase|nr:amino acid--tRNA ligase-related protein [Candidatus Paceibacterota bacterium]
MERVFIGDLKKHVGQTVTINGWISVRRDQGKLVFFDVRDMSGTVQGVVLPASPAMEVAKSVRIEYAVAITGTVNKRPSQNVQSDKQNGDIELKIDAIDVLAVAETPPFDLSGDTAEVGEETRLQYRYLDLRSARMQRNMRLRSEFVRLCREYLFARKFAEIETPLLTESTPEGSRDFVVPSRLHPGNFYALPQSPQQYKQLLMVAGFERYFQIARAVRDEDLRADRGFEHSQIDIEMSFVDQEDVMRTIEEMMTKTVEALGFTIKEKPFPRFTYAEAMDTFGADKFDLRTDAEEAEGVLAYAWVYKFPFFEKTDDGKWTFTHNPFSMPIPEHVGTLLSKQNVGEILTTQYDLVCNGFETGGGSIRAHRPELLQATYEIMGYTKEEAEERIGHMLEAFKFGAPPHGGIALGIERNLMNLTGESYLREVQAFPMSRGGQTAVMRAPKPLTPQQLQELGIEIKKKRA